MRQEINNLKLQLCFFNGQNISIEALANKAHEILQTLDGDDKRISVYLRVEILLAQDEEIIETVVEQAAFIKNVKHIVIRLIEEKKTLFAEELKAREEKNTKKHPRLFGCSIS